VLPSAHTNQAQSEAVHACTHAAGAGAAPAVPLVCISSPLCLYVCTHTHTHTHTQARAPVHCTPWSRSKACAPGLLPAESTLQMERLPAFEVEALRCSRATFTCSVCHTGHPGCASSACHLEHTRGSVHRSQVKCLAWEGDAASCATSWSTCRGVQVACMLSCISSSRHTRAHAYVRTCVCVCVCACA